MTTDVLPVDLTPPAPPPPPPPVAGPPRARTGPLRRLWRGRPADPAWVRPALLVLLAGTAVLYLWDLGASGWANSFYSAAVQAGTRSWKAFFFGSSDAANFITVDKPPASLWVMELSARAFGLSSWSILVPQALEGVASVAVLYAAVRRSFRPGAALIAGAVLATTPVAALMFRYNNPDALLVLLLTVATYATVRALERASTGWLVLAMAAVGTGFITKMMQALLVVPALALVYLVAAPTPVRRRLGQLAVAAVALVVSAGWWVAAVQLTPAADRPYIGGSQDNSLLNLIFGYNGLGRLSGNESGSVGGAGAAGSRWGPTGLLRFFTTDFGGDISWLLPAALVLGAACLWAWRRHPRTDRPRAAVMVWGGSLLVTVVVISLAQGIIHPYYTVAAAPAIGALVGMGASTMWERRHHRSARAVLALTLAGTVVWAFVLLDRTPTWLPALRVAVLVVGLGAAAALVAGRSVRGKVAVAVGATALGCALAAPAAYSLDTATTPHAGAIPSAGPLAATGPGGGPGGAPGAAGRGGFGALSPGAGSGSASGAPGAGGSFPAGAGSAAGSFPAGGPSASAGPSGFSAPSGPSGGSGSGLPSAGTPPSSTGRGGAAGGAPGGRGAGGFLSISTPGRALVRTLEAGASRYSWVAATVNANNAAGYQLATGDPVMAIGGFNGTDPAPTLGQFEKDVAAGKVHYFIAGGGGGAGPGVTAAAPAGAGRTAPAATGGAAPGAGGGGTSTTASQITSWVESHFSARTVDGVTVYDLTPTR